MSGDAASQGAWRSCLGDGSTTNIDLCGPRTRIWTVVTWSGDSTGIIPDLLEKFDALEVTAKLNGKAVRVLQESPSTLAAWTGTRTRSSPRSSSARTSQAAFGGP